MKTLSSISVLSFFLIVSCNSGSENTERTENGENREMHEEHRSLKNNFAHQNIKLLKKPQPSSNTTTSSLQKVLEDYFRLSDAVFHEDHDSIEKMIEDMTAHIEMVPDSSFEGESKEAWLQHDSLYLDKLKEMRHISGIKEKRSYFAHISEIMYCTVKSFGISEGQVKVNHCPMAFNGKGAYWLSVGEELKNPYFGKEMATCGEVKERL